MLEVVVVFNTNSNTRNSSSFGTIMRILFKLNYKKKERMKSNLELIQTFG